MPTPSCHAWLALLRLPNQFTVPGDVLAGYALASAGFALSHSALALGGALAASFLLYGGGLLLNDWFDRAEDAQDRPDRPIPSGAVRAGTVLAAGAGSLATGVAAAALAGGAAAGGAAVLALTILLYNGGGKRVRVLGPALMAACRLQNVWLGGLAALGSNALQLPVLQYAGLAIFAYIFLVTWIAAGETRRLPPRPAVWLLRLTPLLVLLAGLPGWVRPGAWGVWGLWAVLALATWLRGGYLLRLREVKGVGPLIGGLIRDLIFIQAFWILASGGSCWLTAGLLLLWLGAQFSSRSFAGS